MRIVLFNWRDRSHPRAGGAELYTHLALRSLAREGHDCIWYSSRGPSLPSEQQEQGYRVIRRGSELTCRFLAALWLFRNRRAFDLVIDEVNTLPWFSRLLSPHRTVLLIHQLAREVWFWEAPPLLRRIGYWLEPLFLRLYRRAPVITVSNSTAASLRDVGLRGQIHVVENPLLAAFDVETKPQIGHVAFIGRLTPSKRIDDIIRAVALAANTNQCIKLTIIGAGSSAMIKELRELTKRLGVAGKVRFVGRVSDEERDSILETVDVLALASVREGWGLVVSEAARWRIPTVGYKVAGLVDSVVHGQTGLLVEEQTPAALSEGLLHLIGDRQMRDRFGAAAAARLTDFSAEHFHDKLITALNSVPLQ